MKLLAKKEISIDLARQKKIQIDEGIGLARKVDALREQLQTETGNLRRFREESLGAVQQEIDAVVRQKDTLKGELKDLLNRRTVLLIPLDAEWEKLTKAKRDFTEWELELHGYSENLSQRQAQVENEEKEISEEKLRIAGLKEQTLTVLEEADSMLVRARESSAEMRNKAQAVLSEAELKNKEASLRDKSIENREYWVEKEASRVADWEADLEKREKVLRDRAAMLDRNIKRFKK